MIVILVINTFIFSNHHYYTYLCCCCFCCCCFLLLLLLLSRKQCIYGNVFFNYLVTSLTISLFKSSILSKSNPMTVVFRDWIFFRPEAKLCIYTSLLPFLVIGLVMVDIPAIGTLSQFEVSCLSCSYHFDGKVFIDKLSIFIFEF